MKMMKYLETEMVRGTAAGDMGLVSISIVRVTLCRALGSTAVSSPSNTTKTFGRTAP